jgi:hypothetical protein
MEPQEVERAIQFLLAQRAQFATDLQQTREFVATGFRESRELSDRRHGQVTEALIGLTSIVGGLADAERRIERQHAELAEGHKETQANLNSLMLVVEKYFRERKNGGGPH